MYTYDGLDRLTNYSTGTMNSSGGIASPTASESWSLDAAGNWINSSSGSTVTARTNNGQNQATTVGSATLYYDSNGNTITDQNGQQYVYDAWNRLVEVTGANGTILAQYSYDAEGRQMTQTDTGTTTDLYNSNQDQVLQENQGSLVTAEHVWSPFYVDAMIQTVTDPQVTTAESNGSVNTGFGTNTSNHSTTTTLSFGGEGQAVADGSDTLVAVAAGGTAKLLWYNASGGLDTAFGGGTGIVTVSGFTNWSDISGLVIQPNGMIDLAIQTTSGGMEVAQLNYNGSINSSFGSGGLATAGGSLPKTDGIALAANGDILLASVARANSSSATFYVAALNSSSGSLDSSFGSSGVASQTVSGSSGYYVSYTGFGVQPDGNIIVGGQYSEYISGSTVDGNVLVGFTPTGTVNSSFGTSGVASDALGAQSGTMVVAPGGQIYICSIVSDDDDDGAGFYLQRYLANGTLDTSFGSDGVAGVALDGEFEAVILNILASGQIVVGAGGYEGNFVLARFNLDGSLDTAFGSDGVETGAAVCYGMAMALTSSGEAVLVGDDTAETGIILQEFGTLSAPQTLYVEYDTDYNVTSLTDIDGNVVERYSYDPYGNVTVLNPDGTQRGDGTAASSFYGWVYLHQGLRLDVVTGLYDDGARVYDPSLGRFLQEDPLLYVNGSNLYEYQIGNPVDRLDSSGTQVNLGQTPLPGVGPLPIFVGNPNPWMPGEPVPVAAPAAPAPPPANRRPTHPGRPTRHPPSGPNPVCQTQQVVSPFDVGGAFIGGSGALADFYKELGLTNSVGKGFQGFGRLLNGVQLVVDANAGDTGALGNDAVDWGASEIVGLAATAVFSETGPAAPFIGFGLGLLAGKSCEITSAGAAGLQQSYEDADQRQIDKVKDLNDGNYDPSFTYPYGGLPGDYQFFDNNDGRW